MLLILQKSLKSLQLVLNEFFEKLKTAFITATPSAFTQARSKLVHTAFIELNEKAIIEPCYEEGNYETYKGFRLLGIDGSVVILPNEEEIRETFGVKNIANQFEKTKGQQYTSSMVSVMYDLLNNIGIDSIMGHCRDCEIDLAIEHLKHTRANDLLIFDRGYPSYIFLATLLKQGVHFVGRCSRASYKEARKMFKQKRKSKIVTLKIPKKHIEKAQELGLPLEIKVRFVRIILDTGEVEVLVTSLLEKSFTNADFKYLYNKRWGIETFYGILKGRLNLENFTGKTVESVKQDFYASVFITGLESILTKDAQVELDKKTPINKYPQKVNKAVSFNTIKNYVIELFYEEDNEDIILKKLTELFLTNPVCVRADRKVPRKKSSDIQLLSYHKRKKKICF